MGHIPSVQGRFVHLDALRGAAVLWMTAFHFCFDLSQFHFIQANFYRDALWLWQRTCILSLFLLCAGMGQALALHAGQSWRQFGRRWLQIVLCAALVSAGSATMFPHSWIYFGVLHGMAVMLVLCRLTAHWGRWLWLAGAMPIALDALMPALHATFPALAVFDLKALSCLGLVSHKPITEDFVPLLPWMGVMWWGMALGQWGLACSWQRWCVPSQGLQVLVLPRLAFVGRWSLSWYMLHQPLLIGLLTAWVALRR